MSEIYSGIIKKNIKCYKIKLIYHSGLSFSFVCVNLSDVCSLESFLIFGCFASPLSTVGLHCAIVCVNATCIACVDPLMVSYSLSSGDVCNCGLVSSSEELLSVNNHSVSLSSLDFSPPCDVLLSFIEHKCMDLNAV